MSLSRITAGLISASFGSLITTINTYIGLLEFLWRRNIVPSQTQTANLKMRTQFKKIQNNLTLNLFICDRKFQKYTENERIKRIKLCT